MKFDLAKAVREANAEYFADKRRGKLDAERAYAGGVGFNIPVRLLKPEDASIAQRYIGREICSDTKQYDTREMMRAYNRKGD